MSSRLARPTSMTASSGELRRDTAKRRARLDAVGGDDAVARIEEKRRTILEEIKDGARRYLTLRAGVAAADEALRLYRDRHRGAMMERASKAFSEISRGAYRGLTAAAERAERDADRARRRRRLEGGRAIVERRAVPALSCAARRRLSRARQDRARRRLSSPTTSWRPSTISAPRRRCACSPTWAASGR